MSAVHDLRPMDMEEARAFLLAKDYYVEMPNNDLTGLVRNLPRSEQMLMRRALLTVGTADLLIARAEISAAATVQRILGL